MQIELKKQIEVPLEALADSLQCSKQQLITQALEDFLLRQKQESFRVSDTLTALAEADAEQLVDGEEVLSWIATWGIANERVAPK